MDILFLFVIISHHNECYTLLSLVLAKKERGLADAIKVMGAMALSVF